ncbi:MAG TPA: flagellar hook-associated protein FlgL [Desulfitobacteriaceae bacterium]|nr:flagellar hook-associated protein FlgL [Desulfitobacteriaceae bacterium]
MRITNNMIIQNAIKDINNNLVKLSKLQAQASSQRKIEVPSDDPVVAARSLKLTSYMSDIQQYQKNTEDANSWMEYTDSALEQIGDILITIREKTVEAANGILTDDDKSNLKAEIEELKKEIIEIANTNYSGRYIFGGYRTNEAPFAIVSTDVGDQILYNGKYLSLGGAVSASISDSDLADFYLDNMGMLSGQPELSSAAFASFTAASPALDFTITLDGVSSTISLTDGETYDIDTLVTELQSQVNAAFPSDSGEPDPIIKVRQDDGKIVLTVQAGSSISISNGTLDVSELGFSEGMTSSLNDKEEIRYKVGTSNWVTINVEGSDIFGQGGDSLFDTLIKLELALDGETQYKTATYDEGPPAGITVATNDLDISGLLDNLDEDINRVLVARADLGARTSYVELTQTRLDNNEVTYSELLSQNDDVDLAEVSVNLASAQAAYSAALAASAKVMQNSLLDYLR